jgi:hypothetical protein
MSEIAFERKNRNWDRREEAVNHLWRVIRRVLNSLSRL